MSVPRLHCVGIFIGRFQPFHLGHQFVVEKALEQVAFLIIVIGSSQAARSLKNPFNYQERESLIRENLKFFLSPKDVSRVHILGVPDIEGDNNAWMEAVHDQISPCLKLSDQSNRDSIPQIFLMGHKKDESTYYLDLLKNSKNWDTYFVENYQKIDGTKIREAYFSGKLWDLPSLENQISPVTQNFLHNFERTPEWDEISKNNFKK